METGREKWRAVDETCWLYLCGDVICRAVACQLHNPANILFPNQLEPCKIFAAAGLSRVDLSDQRLALI